MSEWDCALPRLAHFLKFRNEFIQSVAMLSLNRVRAQCHDQVIKNLFSLLLRNVARGRCREAFIKLLSIVSRYLVFTLKGEEFRSLQAKPRFYWRCPSLAHLGGVPRVAKRRTETDQLHEFLNICIERDADAVCPAGTLYRAFTKFADLNSLPELTKTAFGLKLKDRGIVNDEDASKRFRKTMKAGVRLTPAGEAYLSGNFPTPIDGVIEGGFVYRIDTKTNRAKSVSELTYEIREAVDKDCHGMIPPVGRKIATRVGTFERLE
ncbi:hypothetical protein [Salipiger bermudensis]|uniref:hypothetical protein n=1 Tax=Salipiger bermudensis TaxID=344736 RepID=UPI001CD6FDA6|nr:hypothetical protein [Salipiger bermudensis]MCA0961974.1 hypothetical protein [Salipiger bermudensis]